MSEPEIILHGTRLSGHAHRVLLMLGMLELRYRFVDAPNEVRRSPEFLRLNPLGQVPVLQDGALVLADSNAILVYLVKRYAPATHWLPEEPVAASHVQRWLSIGSSEVKHGPALARAIAVWRDEGDPVRATAIAGRLFRFMESHLAGRSWLATEQPTVADLSLYPYVARAPEGGISLEPYPAIRAWLSRVEALPKFQPMPHAPIPTESRRAG